MRTPVRLSCDDNDILLKKAISRISNVSKNSFKKIYLFWVGPKWEVDRGEKVDNNVANFH